VLHDYARSGTYFVDSTSPAGLAVSHRIGDLPITADDATAMAWVNQNVPSEAVVATNRHCVSGRQRPRCLEVAFWVSGLGGRRTVMEGWGYTSAAKSLTAQTPFPERLAVNDAVFTDPSAGTIDRLRSEYGASWLVADKSAGPVSSNLARFAAAKFTKGAITVYQLR
jgi:hypothetical protein